MEVLAQSTHGPLAEGGFAMPWGRVAGAGAAAAAGALAARYAAGLRRIDRSWPVEVAPRLTQIGEVDHVGGLRNLRRRTFSFAAEPLEPRGVPAYVPTEMHHDRAQVLPTTAPRVVAPGMAVLPPLPRMLFWIGGVAEQALVVNVRGFGLVVVTGCGHPPIDRMLGVAEQVLDVPIRAVVGGLHLPVHPLGTPLVPQAVLGSPHWPWRVIGERDVAAVIEEISGRGPRIVALSSHDSTPWTYGAFARAFGDRYRTLQVGEELRIGQFSAGKTPGS